MAASQPAERVRRRLKPTLVFAGCPLRDQKRDGRQALRSARSGSLNERQQRARSATTPQLTAVDKAPDFQYGGATMTGMTAAHSSAVLRATRVKKASETADWPNHSFTFEVATAPTAAQRPTDTQQTGPTAQGAACQGLPVVSASSSPLCRPSSRTPIDLGFRQLDPQIGFQRETQYIRTRWDHTKRRAQFHSLLIDGLLELRANADVQLWTAHGVGRILVFAGSIARQLDKRFACITIGMSINTH